MTHIILSVAACQFVNSFSSIRTITRAASAERVGPPSFIKVHISIVTITEIISENIFGIHMRNEKSPTEAPVKLAFILSNASLLESYLSGARTNKTDIMLQLNWCSGKQ